MARKQEEEKEDDQAAKSNPFFGLDGQNTDFGKFANALRQSLNQLSPNKKDYDLRQNSFLHSMRKMFEEARTSQDVPDLNGEVLWRPEMKAFDGTVPKEEFTYVVLDKEAFTLTRNEVANVVSLMGNIGRDDKGAVDVDELQFSLVSYTKYYELIESRISDLLEKFKLAICKKLDTDQEVEDLAQALHNKAPDSMITLVDLRYEMEDRRGIVVREALYDQLSSYFDLDRSG